MTLLQASAGTGKTFTIAALTTRYVAEGLPDRPPPRHHLHPDGHRRAARAGARPAGPRVRRAGRPRLDGGVSARDDEIVRLLADGSERRGGGAAPTGWARRSRTSTPPPSRRRTDSACRCSTASGTAGDVDREVTLVEDVQRPHGRGGRRPLPAAVRQQARTRSTSPGSDAMEIADARPQPTRRPGRARCCPTRRTCRPSAAASPRRCARRWTDASGRSRSSPTTTC